MAIEPHVDRGLNESVRCGVAEARSPEWPRVEKEHLRIQPHCACCKPGTNEGASLQVHHKFPFHYCIALGRPDLELDQRNLITLCENTKDKPSDDHHLLIGHLDNFQSSNLNVDKDVVTFNGMTAAQIKADPRWRTDEKGRLKPLNEMTQDDKNAFISLMNSTFPKSDKTLNE
jgi:hypothetical protein